MMMSMVTIKKYQRLPHFVPLECRGLPCLRLLFLLLFSTMVSLENGGIQIARIAPLESKIGKYRYDTRDVGPTGKQPIESRRNDDGR